MNAMPLPGEADHPSPLKPRDIEVINLIDAALADPSNPERAAELYAILREMDAQDGIRSDTSKSFPAS